MTPWARSTSDSTRRNNSPKLSQVLKQSSVLREHLHEEHKEHEEHEKHKEQQLTQPWSGPKQRDGGRKGTKKILAVWVDFVNETDKEDNNGREMCKFYTAVGLRGCASY